MTTTRALLPLAISAAIAVAAGAQQLPLEPLRETGQSVTPAYEGWYRNADGTISLLVGYELSPRAHAYLNTSPSPSEKPTS